MRTRRRLRARKELEELFEEQREGGLQLDLGGRKADAAKEALQGISGPLKSPLAGANGLLGGGSGLGKLEELLGEAREPSEDGGVEGPLKDEREQPASKVDGNGARGKLGNLGIDDLGRLGTRQRADAMHGLQQRVGNQAVTDELESERNAKWTKASGEFDAKLFPLIYLEQRHRLKAHLTKMLMLTELKPVVGDFPDSVKKQHAQRKEKAWWDCLLDKRKDPRAQLAETKRDHITLEEALREIAAFRQLGLACPYFDELHSRERRKYLQGKGLLPRP